MLTLICTTVQTALKRLALVLPRRAKLESILARALIWALLIQFFPFQLALPPGERRPPDAALGLSDIARLLGPDIVYADITALVKVGASSGSVDQGQNIVYTLALTNTGSTITNPRVVDVIDMQHILDLSHSNVTPGWASTNSAKSSDPVTVTFFLTSDMAAGSSAILQITLTPFEPITDGVVITNNLYYATWGGSRFDGSQVVTTVIHAPAFELSSRASSRDVCAGAKITYTVYLTNSGHKDTSKAFTLTVDLDNDAQFIGGTDAPAYGGGTITWVNGAILKAGETISRTFWVTASSGARNRDVLTHTARAFSPLDVTPDGRLTITSTVDRVAADFAAVSTVCSGHVVTFTRLYSDVAVTGGYWDWGDGTAGSSSLVSPMTHTFTSNGYYTVTHTVTGTCAAVQTHTYSATIFVDGATADLEPSTPISVCENSTVVFTATVASSSTIKTYHWDFGDGNTTTVSNRPTATNTYLSSGLYTVTLTITNDNGCVSTLSRPRLILVDGVTPDFEPSAPISICVGADLVFTDTSVAHSDVVTREWDFGDGGVQTVTGTTATTVTHHYLNGGYYTVTLRATNRTGCTETISRTRIVFVDSAEIDLVAAPSSACLNSQVTFTAVVTHGVIASYQWDFGDGTPVAVATAPTITHLYALAGYHTVILTATTREGGCDVVVVKTNYILIDDLTPGFEPSTTITVCSSDATVTFTDTSTAGSGITAHRWNWGDGHIDTMGGITTASHTYAAPGYYTVTLTVTNTTGCSAVYSLTSAVFVNHIEASMLPASPIYFCMVGNSRNVSVQSTSVASDTITEHAWNFGDGTPILNMGPITTANHTYHTGGSFTVTLAVTAGQCSAIKTIPRLFNIDLVIPSFEPTQTVSVCTGAAVYLTDTSQFSGTITIREWDFGDGATSANLSNTLYVSHTYLSSGMYTVSLRVRTIGCQPVTTHTINVIAVGQAQAAFTHALTVCTGASAPFTYTGSVTGVLDYCEWDFGDGSPTATGVTVTHQYLDPGKHTVVLTVTTTSGCYDVVTGTIFVEGTAVSFDPPAPQRACLLAPVTFSDTSVVSGAYQSLVWDLGDGVTSTLPITDHAYAAPGSYTVTLTVETTAGCRTTITRANWITVEAIAAAILPAAPLVVCIGRAVVFTDASTVAPGGGIAARQWDWGSGAVDTTPVVTHTFDTGGTFVITLAVTSTGGCSAVITREVQVQGAVVAFDVTVSPCFQAGGVVATFTNTTALSGTIDFYEWRFGDGAVDSTHWGGITHTYNAAGTYTATLFVSMTAGCTYTTERVISMDSLAISMTHSPPVSACAGAAVLFTDTSRITGVVASRLWEFGDGATASGAVASHLYDVGGRYVVTLTVATGAGCTRWITSAIYIDDIHAAFTSTASTLACVGSSIRFSDTSSATSGVSGIVWDLGDGATSTEPLTNHVYASAGVYTVWLTATNTSGCRRAVSMTVDVQAVNAGITPPAGTICQYELVTFLDASTVSGAIAAWLWRFDDGATAHTRNVSHTFTNSGLQTISLVVTTTLGCTDTIAIVVDVQPQPTPDIQISVAEALVDAVVYFTDTGSAAGSTWEWNFGDGSTAGPLNTRSVSHTYRVLSDTTVTVALTVTSASGCVSVTQRSLRVSVVQVHDLVVWADPGVILAGESTTVCVRITDTLGRPITDGTSVALSFAPNVGVLAATTLTTTGGMACTTFTANSPASDTVEIEALAGAVSDVTQVIIRPEFALDLVLARYMIEVRDSVRLTVTVRDGRGNLVPDGTPVTLTQSPAWGEFPGGAASVVLYTAGGQASTTFTGLLAGLVSLTAAVGAYQDQETVSISLLRTFLPVVRRNYGPDLEVLDVQVMLVANGQPLDHVLVTIRNNGPAPVENFWVDLYLDPRHAPQSGETWPQLCKFGKAWFVRTRLQAGETWVLDTRSPDDPGNPGTRYSIWPETLPGGAHELYAQVDSYWKPLGLIGETNEDNNILGPVGYDTRAASVVQPRGTPTPQP